MRTLLNTMMIAGTMMVSATLLNSVHAQDMNNGTTVQQDGNGVIRIDKLKSDLSTPAERRDTDVYDRSVSLGQHGFYDVVITDAEGRLKMTGRYLDQELKMAEGEFTYFYPNGNVESRGLYANNMKTGTWERFNDDGTRKAERVYAGLTWEDMAIQLGVSEKASAE